MLKLIVILVISFAAYLLYCTLYWLLNRSGRNLKPEVQWAFFRDELLCCDKLVVLCSGTRENPQYVRVVKISTENSEKCRSFEDYEKLGEVFLTAFLHGSMIKIIRKDNSSREVPLKEFKKAYKQENCYIKSLLAADAMS
jgi:hypothetical protein